MIKKIAALIMCALCLTACASEIPPVKEPVPENMRQVITPPENGWTAEELMSVSYVGGIQLAYPLTMESMGGSVYFEPQLGAGFAPSADGFLWYNIVIENELNYFGDVNCKAVTFFRETDDATADEPVRAIRLSSTQASLNGVKYNMPADDIEKYLGTPDRTEELEDNLMHYIYLDRESGSVLIDVRVNKFSNAVVYADVTF